MEKKKSKSFLAFCKKHEINPDNVPEVMSFDAACKQQKVNPKKLPIVKHLPAVHRKRLIADYKLSIIANAIRGGKQVDYSDTTKDKWFPVFKVQADAKRPSGFGLSYDHCVHWRAHSAVGVRLCFPNWDMAKFFGVKFLPLHKDHHLYT